MNELEEKNSELSQPTIDRYSTWGNPHNPHNVDFSTLVFYSSILDVLLNVFLVIIVLLVLVIVGLVIFIFINPDFVRFIFDDGSSVPCIYNPLTKTFTQ
ncbi:hypothetical protein [Acinetobacter gyllenbergii]|uniref:hypothetical protein n=1 Tax=Acinetobacter gyllenbergii TaxID=134534 RepID=UPI003F55A885